MVLLDICTTYKDLVENFVRLNELHFGTRNRRLLSYFHEQLKTSKNINEHRPIDIHR